MKLLISAMALVMSSLIDNMFGDVVQYGKKRMMEGEKLLKKMPASRVAKKFCNTLRKVTRTMLH